MKKFKKIIISILTSIILISSITTTVYADSEQFLVLGKDLSEKEEQTVLGLLGIDNIENYNVSFTTNEEEYKYLGNYLSSSVIGSRALSSVLLTKREEGSGINIETFNITYCSKEMYQNALITAGIKDVDVKIAGPFKLSGTAALVSTIKSYEIMTGEKLDADAVDTANNEIVVTGKLGEEVGKEDAANLIAALKQKVSEMDEYSKEEIENALNDLTKELDISISDETKQSILDLMDKVSDINIDTEAIKQQAKDIYDNIKDYTQELESSGIFQTIVASVKNFLNAIIDFFKNLGGN